MTDLSKLTRIRALLDNAESYAQQGNHDAAESYRNKAISLMARHGIEELFAEGKGEVGLAHYEVRSWVGWHHHVTLSLLALWFLQLERRRLGGKKGSDVAERTKYCKTSRHISTTLHRLCQVFHRHSATRNKVTGSF